MSAQATSPLAKSRLKSIPPSQIEAAGAAEHPAHSLKTGLTDISPLPDDTVWTTLSGSPRASTQVSSLKFVSKMAKLALTTGPALAVLLWIILVLQPTQVQNIPFPMWYGPVHILSWWVIWQLLGQLSGARRSSAILAGAWQTWWFLKLQQVEISWQLVIILLVLFGTIELCANLITHFTRLRPQRSSKAALSRFSRFTSPRGHT